MLRQEKSSKYRTAERQMQPLSPKASRAIPGKLVIGLRILWRMWVSGLAAECEPLEVFESGVWVFDGVWLSKRETGRGSPLSSRPR